MRKKPKATTKPWFSRLLRHPARKRSGSILGHNTHPGPTRGKRRKQKKGRKERKETTPLTQNKFLVNELFFTVNASQIQWTKTNRSHVVCHAPVEGCTVHLVLKMIKTANQRATSTARKSRKHRIRNNTLSIDRLVLLHFTTSFKLKHTTRLQTICECVSAI